MDDGNATYLLSFSPDQPADGHYHAITVKLIGKQRGLTLRYRTGYLYTKEPATLKDRFQQAVWQPADANELTVTTKVLRMEQRANLKLNIAAGGLDVEQQSERWMDKLDVFFIQRDDAGLHAQVEGQTLGLRLKSSTYQKLLSTGIPYEHRRSVAAGYGFAAHSCRGQKLRPNGVGHNSCLGLRPRQTVGRSPGQVSSSRQHGLGELQLRRLASPLDDKRLEINLLNTSPATDFPNLTLPLSPTLQLLWLAVPSNPPDVLLREAVSRGQSSVQANLISCTFVTDCPVP